MIDVRVREHHRVNIFGNEREWGAVTLVALLAPLDQAAVQENSPGGRFDQMTRAGHLASRAVK